MKKFRGTSQRTGARLRLLLLGALLLVLVPANWSRADLSVDAQRPALIITAPAEAHAFPPGATIQVAGNATDNVGVHAIKLEYWLANKLVLRELANCVACGQLTTEWTHAPQLSPGYYIVKAYAYDLVGNQSAGVSRSFVTGLQTLPAVTPPPIPTPSTETPVPVPAIGQPKNGTTVPAADRPVPASGRAEPGSEVTLYELQGKNGEPIATVTTDNTGRWKTQLHLPTGRYTIGAQTTESAGGISKLSKTVTFTVDADRPQIDVITEDETIFTPIDPVTLEGRFLDNRKVGYLVVEYWLLNRLILQDKVFCPACDQQEMAWTHVPKLTQPGYYYVRVRGFDAAGNGAWTQTTTFVKV